MQATKKSKYMQNHNDIKQPFKKKISISFRPTHIKELLKIVIVKKSL